MKVQDLRSCLLYSLPQIHIMTFLLANKPHAMSLSVSRLPSAYICPYNIHRILSLGGERDTEELRSICYVISCYITLYYKYVLQMHIMLYIYITIYYILNMLLIYIICVMYCITYYICYNSTYIHETVKPVRIPGYYSSKGSSV